jgi:hypothetical protein
MSFAKKISKTAFENIQRDAGVILTKFDVTNPSIDDKYIVTATTGGIEVSAVPDIVDDGEDIDNCPNNTKELARIEGWTCTMKFTALEASPDVIRLSLGAADAATDGKITPRSELKDTDFADIWWVGDCGTSGVVAVRLINALSTEGYSLKTEKNGKGQNSVTLTGYTSLDDPDVVPIEFYSITVTA